MGGAGDIFVFVSALLLLAAAPEPPVEDEAVPQMSDKRQFSCPVGGERFTQEVGYHVFPFVSFPDGSYLGDDKVDAEIPVCPGNGLVILPDFERIEAESAQRMLYSDYGPAELQRLPGLIADPAYSALKADGRHMQAYWLATRLGRSARLRFILLQRATWAATDPALRGRLIARLVEEGPALIDSSGLPAQAKRARRYLIVNALRELGRFDEALALMESVEREGGPPVPAPIDPDNTYGADEFAPLMRVLIAEKDMDRFPLSLMQEKWAREVCSGEEMPPPYGPLSAKTRAACAVREAERARRIAEDEASFLEMSGLETALVEDEAAYGILCPNDGALAFPDRASLVSVACSGAAQRRYDMKIDRMLADPAALDAQCVGRNPEERSDLAIACAQRASQLEQAERERIAADDAAFAGKCGRYEGQLSELADVDVEEDEALRSCRVIQSMRDSRRSEASGGAGPAESMFDDSGSLMTEAHRRASAMIAVAKADGTYPKRRPGDLD